MARLCIKNQEFKDLVRLDVVCMFLSCRGAPRPYKIKGSRDKDL